MNEQILHELLSEISNVSSELKDISGELAELNKNIHKANGARQIQMNAITNSLQRMNGQIYGIFHGLPDADFQRGGQL